MVYAFLEFGGKQLKAKVGENLYVEKIDKEEGDAFVFDKVLFIRNNDKCEIGKPLLKAKVSGVIKKQGKEKKVIIFRTKAKSNWKTKKGHRQMYTNVLIKEIILNGKTIDKFIEKSKISVPKKVTSTPKIDSKLKISAIDSKSKKPVSASKSNVVDVKVTKTSIDSKLKSKVVDVKLKSPINAAKKEPAKPKSQSKTVKAKKEQVKSSPKSKVVTVKKESVKSSPKSKAVTAKKEPVKSSPKSKVVKAKKEPVKSSPKSKVVTKKESVKSSPKSKTAKSKKVSSK